MDSNTCSPERSDRPPDRPADTPPDDLAVLAAAERFLAKHLGGRFQESMPPDVAERLKVLTVNVKELSIVTKPKEQ